MAAFLLFAGLLGFYLATAYPTLSPYRDSGDLAASALTLGVAHPPGYPLYSLGAKAWLELFGLGNAAYRLHVFSALLGALACALVFRALARGGSREAGASGAAAAALLLGLAPAFRHLSVVSEMYSLNACLAALLLLLLSREGGASPRELCAGALVLGLGLGNHQTLLAAAPLLLAAGWRKLRSSRALWGLALLFVLAGLLVYAYLPLRSSLEPALDWGEPRALRSFLRMLTRADYGGVRLHPERPAGLLLLSGWLDGLRLSAAVFSKELGLSGAALFLLGCWSGRGALRSGALAGFLLSGPLFVVWANLDPAKPETYAILEPHLVLPLLFAAVLAGLGAQALFGRFQAGGKAAAAALLAALWPWPSTGLPVSHREDFSAWDYGTALLDSLKPGTVLVDPDDPTAFTLSYLLHAHARRPDVVPFLYFRTRWGYEQLRRRHPELLPPREIRSGQELVSAVVSKAFQDGRPLAVDLPQKTPSGASAFPVGLAYRLSVAPPGREDARALLSESLTLRELLRLPSPPLRADFFTRHTLAYWPSALNNLGVEAQRLGLPAEAARIYRRALSAGPWLSESWNNWGNAALSLDDARAAEGCYLASLRERPSPQVVYNLGRAYFLAGRFSEAEGRFRQAIAEAGLVDAHNDLGLVLLRQGRTDEAVREWLGVLARKPSYAAAYYNLALAFERMGRKAEALKALAAYRELVPDPALRRETDRWMEKLKK
ncbi:MAG TPA: hypothetical protein DCM05_15005 [Elusimicrobia bacterium]|nr:hypothetical protein [Elusimicrobiota bacterium]